MTDPYTLSLSEHDHSIVLSMRTGKASFNEVQVIASINREYPDCELLRRDICKLVAANLSDLNSQQSKDVQWVVAKGRAHPFKHAETNVETAAIDTWIHADGEVRLRFAQFAEIFSDQDIHATELLLHCHVRTKGKLFCGESGSGKLIGGGVTHAYRGIDTKELGAPAIVKTEIILDSEADPSLAEIKQEMAAQLERLEEVRHLFMKIQGIKRDHPIKEKLPQIERTYEKRSYALDALERKYDRKLNKLHVNG